MVKQELLSSIIEIVVEKDYSGKNEEVKNKQRASQRRKYKNHKHSRKVGKVA